jgi:hypothetical protein
MMDKLMTRMLPLIHPAVILRRNQWKSRLKLKTPQGAAKMQQ